MKSVIVYSEDINYYKNESSYLCKTDFGLLNHVETYFNSMLEQMFKHTKKKKLKKLVFKKDKSVRKKIYKDIKMVKKLVENRVHYWVKKTHAKNPLKFTVLWRFGGIKTIRNIKWKT